ncbi:MAG: DUF1674 domain-containing protein [Parvibaculum sp.]
MSNNSDEPEQESPARCDLPDAARRALAEAQERRRRSKNESVLPKEVNGRKGPEPTRYGDWEKDGIISDF